MELNNNFIKIPRYTNTTISCFFCNLLIYIIISLGILSDYPTNYISIWGYTIFLTVDIILIYLLIPLSSIYKNVSTLLYYTLPLIGFSNCFYPFIFNTNDVSIYYKNYPYILLLLLFNSFMNICMCIYYYYKLNTIQYTYYDSIFVAV